MMSCRCTSIRQTGEWWRATVRAGIRSSCGTPPQPNQVQRFNALNMISTRRLSSLTNSTRVNVPYKIQRIPSPRLILGESPHWDEKQQSLFYLGIHDKTIHKYVYATGAQTKTMIDGRPGFMVPMEGTTDQFVVGLERKFLIIQWDGQEESKVEVVRELGEVDQHSEKNRINDGKADPRGRIFAGTMGIEVSPGVYQKDKGSLYRIDTTKGGTIEKLANKIGASNGLAWDLKEKAFYYIDSLERKIRRYDYDVETGDISNPSYIFDLQKSNINGLPDGMTIDTDGNLWVAVYQGSCVLKIDPRTTKLIDTITFPVKQVTSVTFGGPNYDILFVTTASKFIVNEVPPLSGSTFMVTGLGVKGYPNLNIKL